MGLVMVFLLAMLVVLAVLVWGRTTSRHEASSDRREVGAVPGAEGMQVPDRGDITPGVPPEEDPEPRT